MLFWVNAQIFFLSIPASCFLSLSSTSFLFMIALQRFIDFSLYSYFYKSSRRARGCPFYFKAFTIREISTFPPKLLLLCFCGLNSIYIFSLLFFFLILYFPHSFGCFVVWILPIFPFCPCPGSLWIGHFWGCSALHLPKF